jgi:DNA-binding transcriptional LysR family regulator
VGTVTLDLNLLVPLDALLQERSVTRAAQRLGLSQPSLSAALARLRRHYGDELLVRVGNSYELTPLAERLVEHTEQALSWADRVLQTRPDFDPTQARHEFTVIMADCQLPTFGRALADLVRAAAPNVRLRFQHSTERVVQQALDNLRTVDALVLPQGILSNIPTFDLYKDRWVCVVSADRGPAVLGREELEERPWVLPYRHPSPVFSPLNRLHAEGIAPHAEIVTENFLAIPHLVAGTDRIGLMPERVAIPTLSGQPITVAQPAFEIGHLVESLWWHPLHEREPAHIWLRRMAAQAGQTVASGPMV